VNKIRLLLSQAAAGASASATTSSANYSSASSVDNTAIQNNINDLSTQKNTLLNTIDTSANQEVLNLSNNTIAIASSQDNMNRYNKAIYDTATAISTELDSKAADINAARLKIAKIL
jgi:hypothetical protein